MSVPEFDCRKGEHMSQSLMPENVVLSVRNLTVELPANMERPYAVRDISLESV